FYYEKGHGVREDLPEAYKFYKLAVEQNLEKAVGNLKRTVARMTAVEIAEGERRSLEFRSQKNLNK
ncbi:MAG TPA: SEL1-like repeat protein, partial [Verrucomicrobiae bacterium]